MKTLADFKRALQIGTKWHATYVPNNRDMGIRTVCLVQGGSVGFLREDSTAPEDLSYLDFPKAQDFAVNANGEVEIYQRYCESSERVLLLKYKQII